MSRKVVYVSGPLTTGPSIWRNVRRAIDTSLWLIKAGAAPVCPHLFELSSITNAYDSDLPSYEEWMQIDLAVLGRCDALVRIPGDSPGADREVEAAKLKGIPVFMLDSGDWLKSLDDWLRCGEYAR